MPPVVPPYVDVTGNYYGGLDAGMNRAKDTFDTQQKLQTQDALVRLNNPQTAQNVLPTNYAEVQAMQMQAKQLSDAYTPLMQTAIKNKNTKVLKEIAGVYQKSGIPALQKMSGVLDSMELFDDGKYKTRYKFDTPEELAAMYQQMPSLKKNHPQLQPGIEYEFELEGELGSPQTKVLSAEPVKLDKTKEEKPRYSHTSFRTEAGMNGIIARIPKDAPNREQTIAALKLAFSERPTGGEVQVVLENGVPLGEVNFQGGSGSGSEARPYFTNAGTITAPDGSVMGLNFDARTGRYNAIPLPGGDVPGVKNKKQLPAKDAETIGKLKTTLDDIGLVREAWNEGLTGAFEGRANEALQHIRDNPKFETLRRRTNRLITIAYALSGKQISAQEIKLLQTSILPQVKQMDKNFLTALDELEDWVRRNGNDAQDAYEKSRYDFIRTDFGGKKPTEKGKGNIAPAGTKAKLKDGRIVISDGQGGWK
jgi:hypothetical protein